MWVEGTYYIIKYYTRILTYQFIETSSVNYVNEIDFFFLIKIFFKLLFCLAN